MDRQVKLDRITKQLITEPELTNMCNEKVDQVYDLFHTLDPKMMMVPFGGSLHSILRFGIVMCNTNDKYFDDDIDILFVFPHETTTNVHKKRLSSVISILNETTLCDSIDRHKIHVTCRFGKQHIDFGVLLVVEGELRMGWYASTNKNFMGKELMFPTKKCLVHKRIWRCPNYSTGFQSLWQRREYTKKSHIIWKYPWMNSTESSLTAAAIEILDEMGFQSYNDNLVQFRTT
jgi:hypothetical protein